MAEFTLQHAANIQNGQPYRVRAEHLTDNFAALKSDIDDRLTIVAGSPSEVLSQVDFSAGIKADQITESSAGSGVTADSVLLKDGMITIAGVPAAAGQMGYDSNVIKFHNGTTVKTLITSDDIPAQAHPRGYIAGPPPTYQSASTVRLPAGFNCRDDGNAANIRVSSNLDVALSASGALGLDTGSEANSTFYYLWVIRKSSDGTTSAIFSTSNSNPTLPSGYDQKRLVPGAWYNDSSGNIIKQYIGEGWPFASWIYYDVPFSQAGASAGPTQVYSTLQTSYTDVTLTYTPTGTTVAKVKVDTFGNAHSISLRPDGGSDDSFHKADGSNNLRFSEVVQLACPGRVIEYKEATASNISLAVFGYLDVYNNGF